MRPADPPILRTMALRRLRVATEEALHSLGTMHGHKLPEWAYPAQDLLEALRRSDAYTELEKKLMAYNAKRE